MKNNLNIQGKLLLASLALAESGKERFSAEDIVVMAWKKFPEAFGLAGYTDEKGYPIYPNSNRVYAEIMGSKPLRKNGFLRKVGSKMYQLTEAGKVRVQSLPHADSGTIIEKWAIAREQIDFIRRLFDSKAAAKYRSGARDDISFFDACGFWGISSSSNAKDLWSRFAEVDTVLDVARKSLRTKKAVQLKHGSNEFTSNDLRSLTDIHLFLKQKFATEIEQIKKRIHER